MSIGSCSVWQIMNKPRKKVITRQTSLVITTVINIDEEAGDENKAY